MLKQNPIAIETEFHYKRWAKRAGGSIDDFVETIKNADEELLDDLYELREELRLGI
jgi:hypothetical protein